jgi:DNA-directed RNA polymerase subunit E'/Rpb7
MEKNDTKNGGADDLYMPCVADRVICLCISEIMDSSPTDLILKLLRQQVEGKCIKEGFVRPNSVKLRSVCAGKLEGSNVQYNVTFRADVCDPLKDMVVVCRVLTVTKAGLNCTVNENNINPLTVFITRQPHEDTISNVMPGDNIRARIQATTFQIYDTYICALANFDGFQKT